MAAKRGKGVAIIHFYGDQVKIEIVSFFGYCTKLKWIV